MGKLRAVRPGEPARRPMTVTEAAATEDRRDLLVALRMRIAQTVENPSTPAQASAALTRRLLDIVDELEAIDAEGGGDAVGDAAATPDEKWARHLRAGGAAADQQRSRPIPGPAQSGGGAGLAGMRERVAVFRGSLQAGPREDNGFAVSAVLPLLVE